MNNIQLTPVIGMIAGMALGFAGAFGGLGAFLIVLVLGAVGFLLGRVAESGEVNLSGMSLRRK